MFLFIFIVGYSFLLFAEATNPGTTPPIQFSATVVMIGTFILLVVEFILGETTWIPQNSILAVVFSFIIKIGRILFPKKESSGIFGKK